MWHNLVTVHQNAKKKNSVSGLQKLHIFQARHSLGPPTFYLCIKKQFYPTWTQNKQYVPNRAFWTIWSYYFKEEKKAKTRHDTNLLRGLIHGKKKWRTVYVTSFEKLSSVALGCRAEVSLSSFYECLLTSLFTFCSFGHVIKISHKKAWLWFKLSSKAKRARQFRCKFHLFVSMKARKITP